MPADTPPTETPQIGSRDAAPRSLGAHHLRFLALAVDYMTIIVAVKLLDQLLLGEHWDLRGLAPGAPAGMTVSVFASLVVGLGLCKDAWRGVSIGKWIAGVAVAQSNDPTRRASPLQTILRNLTMPLLPIEAVLAFTDRYYRRLGDKLAGTVVVAMGSPPPPGRRLLAMAMLFLVSLLMGFLLTDWNLRRTAAYQTALEATLRHPEVASALGNPPNLGGSPELRMGMEQGRPAAMVLFKGENAVEDSFEVTVTLSATTDLRAWQVESLKVARQMR